MVKKSDIEEMLKKYQPAVKKTGEQLTKAVKAAEEDISRLYKMTQIHVEIQMSNLQKEKLYHEIGKSVSGLILEGKIDLPELAKYKKQLNKIDSATKKKKRAISAVRRGKKKKK